MLNLILYVHSNPVKHNFIDNFENYRYSSYNEIVNNTSKIINSEDIIGLFHDIDNFKYVHKYRNEVLSEKFTLE